MTTRWIHRIIAIIPVGDAEAANAIHTLDWPEGDTEAQTFQGDLSTNGLEPATHALAFTSATDLTWRQWKDRHGDGQYGDLTWYRLDMDNEILLETNSETAETGAVFGYREALADAGLERITQEAI